jgi:glycosyltransferase involved in cell wall biosynthesis
MKILQVSMSDSGGAGIAAVRLHQALLDKGVDCKLLTLKKTRDDIPEHYVFHKKDASIFPWLTQAMGFVDRVLKRFKLKSDYYRSRRKKYAYGSSEGTDMFNFSFSEYHLERHSLAREADIIQLHWVCGGFLDFRGFFKRASKHVVWTLHDMNPFTGGCHYSYDCLGYQKDCHACPQLEGVRSNSIAEKMLAEKIKVLQGQDRSLSIVTPSRWLMACSEKSKLFSHYPHRHIYNIVNAESFYMGDQSASRERLSLPVEKKIILCIGSLDYARKGNKIIAEALPLFDSQDVILCCVGRVSEAHKENPSIVHLGYISDSEKMRDAYNAADVFVLPTMADNLPNTIVESLLCGTPVISYAVGGVTEQVNDRNGLLVNDRSPESMASALDGFFVAQSNYARQSIASEAQEQYAVSKTVDKHMNLYHEILSMDHTDVVNAD